MGIWIRVLMTLNVFFYRLTGGMLGSKMSGQSVLLLHTVGRKTGKAYVTPINYYRDGDRYVVVASNWGKESNPAWYHNLMRQSSAFIQVKAHSIRVRPSLAEGETYTRLWSLVTSKNEFYIRYQQKVTRQIPLVILTPV
jgi:F420H(2)-dependent quinone reductase